MEAYYFGLYGLLPLPFDCWLFFGTVVTRNKLINLTMSIIGLL